jgi:hypothetical protein
MQHGGAGREYAITIRAVEQFVSFSMTGLPSLVALFRPGTTRIFV